MITTPDDLRREVLKSVRDYFALARAPAKFVAGETYIPVTTKVIDVEDLENIVEACLDMWFTTGRFAREFETTLPLHLGRTTSALLVNSGSSANLLALSSLGASMLESFDMKPLRPGDEVITVAAGFPTTINPIFQNGWIPVFVDVDFATLNALPETVMAARSPRTRAVILAHALGNPYRADVIAEWCRAEGLYFVEDCCDALGATIGSSKAPVGSFGDYATLSFYPAHHITMGEGGAVVCKDGRRRRVAESLRDWGRDCWCEPGKDNTCGKRFGWQLGDLPAGYDHKYTYSSVGYNLKATDMQAALGLSQLRKLPQFVEARRRNWQTLYDGIKASPSLRDRLIPVEPTADTDPSWFGFPVHCDPGISREKLVSLLEARRIGTRLMFAGNVTKQPAYRGLDYRISGTLTATDEIMTRTFWLGVHPALDAERITYMLEQLEHAIHEVAR